METSLDYGLMVVSGKTHPAYPGIEKSSHFFQEIVVAGDLE